MTVAEAEPESSLRVQELTAVTDQLSAAEVYLRSLQEDDGHWCGELEGDTILESEYALALYFVGREKSGKFRQLANYLRSRQTAEGG